MLEHPAFSIFQSKYFYTNEQVTAIYGTSNLEVLREHIRFLRDFIDGQEKQATSDNNGERESSLILANYAAMCLRLAEQEMTRRGYTP